jgi:exodeoxyribonuclease-3
LIAARFSSVRLLATYFPSKPPAIAEMFTPLLDASSRLARAPTLLVGDLNAGSNPADTEGSQLTAGEAFDATVRAGWVDLWRHVKGDAREFTWLSPGYKNGFRLDHALLLGADPPVDLRCEYDHGVREAGLSDHSLLEFELRL